jgi:hypothetical protein
MQNLSASKGKIPALLHQMSNSPTGDFWTILLETFASLFPHLLYLPSPLKTYSHTLRTEFGKIAREVWAGKDGSGMHAKVLDALGGPFDIYTFLIKTVISRTSASPK